MMFPSEYESTVEGSVFILKDESFDCGIYLITVIKQIKG